ncbi:MAG: DUF4129 domain-containing protein [Chloroflexi bacterium]|nr:DUF4129 domain-containing protein [Chloroflexota bacterium]
MQALARETPFRRDGFIAALLLALILISMSGSIAAAGWTGGLYLLVWASLGALAVGSLLASVRVPGWIAHLLIGVLAVVSATLLSTLVLPASWLAEEKFQLLYQIWRTWLTLKIAGEYSVYIFLCKQGFLVTDVILPNELCTDSIDPNFLTIMLILNSAIGYAAAWFLYRRQQVWGAIFLPGAAIVINLFYSLPQNGVYFGLFLLCTLLLLIRVNLARLEHFWKTRAVGFSADIGFDFFLYGAIFAFMLLLLTFVLPARAPGPSWLSVLDPWQAGWQDFEEQWRHTFGLRAVGRPEPGTAVASTLIMGGPIKLGASPIMDVQADGGRYWRSTVYDKYTGGGWISTYGDAASYNANDTRLNPLNDVFRREITQTIRIFVPELSTLYAAAQPLRVNVPVEIWRIQPPANVPAAPDIALMRARRPLRAGDQYIVVSAITIADDNSLRVAGQEYPVEIGNYLQLPDGLPDRVRALARAITDKALNPYEQAVAIETYLRTQITYNESVSAPPAGRDAVDYLLFERAEGYCNYFASAMAVLARAVGIPARVASGFARGDYRDGVYHVVESNAHAWPELYFPGYGWIEFEPTASQPLIERPHRDESTPSDDALASAADRERLLRQSNADIFDDEFTQSRSRSNPFLFGLLIDPSGLITTGALIVGILGAGWLAFAQWRQNKRMALLPPGAHVYEEMLARARWLGVREQNSATPFEIADKIAAAMPPARAAVQDVAMLYVRERFAAHSLSALEYAALKSAGEIYRREFWSSLGKRMQTLLLNQLSTLKVRMTESKRF